MTIKLVSLLLWKVANFIWFGFAEFFQIIYFKPNILDQLIVTGNCLFQIGMVWQLPSWFWVSYYIWPHSALLLWLDVEKGIHFRHSGLQASSFLQVIVKYSHTPMKHPPIKWPPSIRHSVIKVPMRVYILSDQYSIPRPLNNGLNCIWIIVLVENYLFTVNWQLGVFCIGFSFSNHGHYCPPGLYVP